MQWLKDENNGSQNTDINFVPILPTQSLAPSVPFTLPCLQPPRQDTGQKKQTPKQNKLSTNQLHEASLRMHYYTNIQDYKMHRGKWEGGWWGGSSNGCLLHTTGSRSHHWRSSAVSYARSPSSIKYKVQKFKKVSIKLPHSIKIINDMSNLKISVWSPTTTL